MDRVWKLAMSKREIRSGEDVKLRVEYTLDGAEGNIGLRCEPPQDFRIRLVSRWMEGEEVAVEGGELVRQLVLPVVALASPLAIRIEVHRVAGDDPCRLYAELDTQRRRTLQVT